MKRVIIKLIAGRLRVEQEGKIQMVRAFPILAVIKEAKPSVVKDGYSLIREINTRDRESNEASRYSY